MMTTIAVNDTKLSSCQKKPEKQFANMASCSCDVDTDQRAFANTSLLVKVPLRLNFGCLCAETLTISFLGYFISVLC